MYVVYVLRSIFKSKYYIGFTADFERRLKEHQGGNSVFDRVYKPFEVILTESYDSKLEAMKREKEIKGYKGGNSFKLLIG